jgi:ABC-type uncharacterized transport system involved in gliding motility auxiliary subunit
MAGISRPFSRRGYAILVIVFAAVILLAINIAASSLLRSARVDLTENGQFTLSQGTRNVIAGIREPITLRFFFSKSATAKYASINDYAGRVSDLLREYANLSGGKIKLEEIDPEPFTEAEDQADAAGLKSQTLDTGEQVYFGLSGTNSVDGRETIPFFSAAREMYLEYDITSLLYRLSHPDKPVVSVLTSLPLAGLQGVAPPYTIYTELSKAYTTNMMAPEFAIIPPNTKVLLIVHPGQLNEAQSYAIDQYVLSGGRVLIFVDPKSELAEASLMSGSPVATPSSDLKSLFAAWGVTYDSSKVVADKSLAIRVGTGVPGQGPISYPIWMRLQKDQFNAGDTLSASLSIVNVATAGALSPTKGAATKFIPLAITSKQASLLAVNQLQSIPQQNLMQVVKPTGQNYTVAARISGEAKTAFPGKGGRQSGNINVIVVADSDLLSDQFWLQTQEIGGQVIGAPFADNYALVMNAIENLSGSDDLISLRTRATRDQGFTVVRDLRARAEEQFQEQNDALEQRLKATQQRLAALERNGSQSGNSVNAAQNTEIEGFRRELIQTRSSLREVQRNLRKDIDALGNVLAFINIALVPLLVAAVAILLAYFRRHRRAAAPRNF